MKKNEAIKNWVKEHKKELILAGVGVATLVGSIFAAKSFRSLKESKHLSSNLSDQISKMKLKMDHRKTDLKTPTAISRSVVTTKSPSEIIENLSGNKLTPTGLGNIVSTSAQNINKKLISHNLQERHPVGYGYSLTDIGKLLGEHRNKCTLHGYPFTNIEWDDSVIDILYSPVELKEIWDQQMRAKEILSKFAWSA